MVIKILLSISMLIFGIVFMLLGTKRYQRMRLLKTSGVIVEGIIDDIISAEAENSDFISYRVNVSFTTKNGDKISDKLPFFPGAEFEKKFSKGDKIMITYFPKNPHLFTAVGYDLTDRFALLFLIIAIALFVSAAYLNFMVLQQQ